MVRVRKKLGEWEQGVVVKDGNERGREQSGQCGIKRGIEMAGASGAFLEASGAHAGRALMLSKAVT